MSTGQASTSTARQTGRPGWRTVSAAAPSDSGWVRGAGPAVRGALSLVPNGVLRSVPDAEAVARKELAPRLDLDAAIDQDRATTDEGLRLPAGAGEAGGLDGLGQRDVVSAERQGGHGELLS